MQKIKSWEHAHLGQGSNGSCRRPLARQWTANAVRLKYSRRKFKSWGQCNHDDGGPYLIFCSHHHVPSFNRPVSTLALALLRTLALSFTSSIRNFVSFHCNPLLRITVSLSNSESGVIRFISHVIESHE